MTECILAAEFDIEKGSSLSFQYPECDLGTDPTHLAELMLPEGAHLHSQDTTVFILQGQEQNSKFEYDYKSRTATCTVIAVVKTTKWMNLCKGDHHILIQDNELSIVEGDAVKLKFSLDDIMIFHSRTRILYFPHLNPPLALKFRCIEDCVFIQEFLQNMYHASVSLAKFPNDLIAAISELIQVRPTLYVLNLVVTRQVEGAARGARVKALAIAFRRPWVHVFKPLLYLAIDEFFENPTFEVVKDIYNAVKWLNDSEIPELHNLEKKCIRNIFKHQLTHFDPSFDQQRSDLRYHDSSDNVFNVADIPLEYEYPVNYGKINLPLKIPNSTYASEIANFSITSFISRLMNVTITNPPATKHLNGIPYSWHPHIDTGPNTSVILVVMFALLTEKRLVFVGHGKSCEELTDCVLACCALASGGDLISDIASRCFPYASLANVESLLSCPGYIAGATNPVFEVQPGWWDIAINLNTNKLTFGTGLLKSAQENSVPTVDISESIDDVFIHDVFDFYTNKVDEGHLREYMYRYVKNFLYSATFGVGMEKEWHNRVSGWQSTHGYQRSKYLIQRSFIPIDMLEIIRQLLDQRKFNVPEVVSLFVKLDKIVQSASDYQLLELLDYLKVSDGACIPLSSGLFHVRFEVRICAARIIQRLYIQKVTLFNEMGSRYVDPFIKLALLRILGSNMDTTKAIYRLNLNSADGPGSQFLSPLAPLAIPELDLCSPLASSMATDPDATSALSIRLSQSGVLPQFSKLSVFKFDPIADLESA